MPTSCCPARCRRRTKASSRSVEGRVIKINKAVDLPGRRAAGLADHSGHRRGAWARRTGFTFDSPARDLRRAAASPRKGGVADYSGITYEKIEQQFGVFWPCPRDPRQPIDHRARRGCSSRARGTRSPRAPGRSISPTARRASTSPPTRRPTEDVDAEYPIILTTGRVVSQFLSGTQTRRIGPLVDQYPEPRIEMHPRLAEKLGITDGDWATAESRRGSCTLQAQVVTTIRPTRSSFPTTGPGRRAPTS